MSYDEELYINIKTLAEAWLPASATKEDVANKCKAISRDIQADKFKSARQVSGYQKDGTCKGRGGKIWQINIADSTVPSPVRIKLLDNMLTLPDQSNLPAVATPALPVAIPKSLTVPATKDLNGKQERIITARYQIIKMIETRKPGKKVMQMVNDIADAINIQKNTGSLP